MAKRTKKAPTKQEQITLAILACKDSGGCIIPSLVVAEARDPNSILHDEFNWDVGEAAQAHWEHRAKQLIRKCRLVVVYEDRKILAPYYVRHPVRKDSAYTPTLRTAKSAALSAQVLQQELGRIRSALHRAKILAAVFNLESSFDRMLQELVEIESNLGFDDDADEARV